jgi:hypothetical protein
MAGQRRKRVGVPTQQRLLLWSEIYDLEPSVVRGRPFLISPALIEIGKYATGGPWLANDCLGVTGVLAHACNRGEAHRASRYVRACDADGL